MNGRISWRWVFLAAILAAAFFIELGDRGLNEPDEGRYATIAREMAVDGDWLIPHLNGIPHFQINQDTRKNLLHYKVRSEALCHRHWF